MIVFHCLLVRLRARRRRIDSWGCCLPPPTSSDNVADLDVPCISGSSFYLRLYCLAGIWVSIGLPWSFKIPSRRWAGRCLILHAHKQHIQLSLPIWLITLLPALRSPPSCAHSLSWLPSQALRLTRLMGLALVAGAFCSQAGLHTRNGEPLPPPPEYREPLGICVQLDGAQPRQRPSFACRSPSLWLAATPVELDGSHLFLARWRPTPANKSRKVLPEGTYYTKTRHPNGKFAVSPLWTYPVVVANNVL